MSITRLQQARRMYAMGQRVAKTLDGSRPGYRGDDAYGGGTTAGGDRSDSPGDRGDGPATNVDLSHFGDPDPEVNVPTANRKDTITSSRNNYAAQKAAMGLLNFLPGAQIYNIGKTAFETNKQQHNYYTVDISNNTWACLPLYAYLGTVLPKSIGFKNSNSDDQAIKDFYKKYIESKSIMTYEQFLSMCLYKYHYETASPVNWLDYIADNTKEKIGKFTPGTHIPIVSIDYFRKNYPNVLLLCSWNHKNEILNKEKKFLKKGGKWISHVKKI